MSTEFDRVMDAALRAVCRAWVLARPVLPPKKETPGVSALQMSLRLIDCARAMLSWSCETRGGGNARALGVVGGVSRLWGSPRSLLQAFGRPAAACTLHLHEPTGALRSAARFGRWDLDCESSRPLRQTHVESLQISAAGSEPARRVLVRVNFVLSCKFLYKVLESFPVALFHHPDLNL